MSNMRMISMMWDYIMRFISRMQEKLPPKNGRRLLDIRLESYENTNKVSRNRRIYRRGLYRMKNFYEVYKDDEFVTTLLTQISWSNHLAILSNIFQYNWYEEDKNARISVIASNYIHIPWYGRDYRIWMVLQK